MLCFVKTIQGVCSFVNKKTKHLQYHSFMGLRKNLREELDRQGLTVKELSAKANIAKGALEMYLGVRESMPPADTAVSIARALGVTVEYLVNGEETALPRDIRSISRNLLKLDERDRKAVSAMVRALVEQRVGL